MVPSSITLPRPPHHGVDIAGPMRQGGTARGTIRSSSRVASGPETRYLYRGETSISAAAFRMAAYSCSCWSSYALATLYPLQRRQAWPWTRGAVREWNGVVLSMAVFRRKDGKAEGRNECPAC